jgi:hypothetical protein
MHYEALCGPSHWLAVITLKDAFVCVLTLARMEWFSSVLRAPINLMFTVQRVFLCFSLYLLGLAFHLCFVFFCISALLFDSMTVLQKRGTQKKNWRTNKLHRSTQNTANNTITTQPQQQLFQTTDTDTNSNYCQHRLTTTTTT